MKVIAFNASARKDGNTAVLLRRVLKEGRGEEAGRMRAGAAPIGVLWLMSLLGCVIAQPDLHGKACTLDGECGSLACIDGRCAADACSGTSLFCDDYSSSALAGSYSTQHGMWTRGNRTYTVTDSVAWERARALLGGDYMDFDVTLSGRSLGDAGFGLSYAAQATDDGFAVVVHPGKFQGVYLKELVAGEQDVNIKSYPLPTAAAGKAMTLRVRRSGTGVTVWLDGTQVLTGDDGGSGRHGRLGLILSVNDQPSGAGAEFSLLRLDSATP